MRNRIYSDHSKYSRGRLDDAIYGVACQVEREMIDEGSRLLLKKLWARHPRILNHHAKAGRLVVRP